ncbi:MAG: alpha/beta fold hydrolase [Verrucomicrobia bacterium]|nr:alpha/beta fold hydrolase [Verrucomicrobiota bacterium]
MVTTFLAPQEEVSFKNPADEVVLKGTFSLPQTETPVPAVVLLHGSAPFDRNSTMLGHQPFLVMADHLSKRGIAVLRFDKRGAGESGGDYNSADLRDFAQDGLAAVEYLKSRKEIDPNAIGFIGHSEGGMTAAYAATQSDDIAFVVSLAAPCVKWEELILTQEEALQRADGVPEDQIQESLAFRKELFKVLSQESDPNKGEILLKALFDQRTTNSCYGPPEAQIAFFNSKWFRFSFTYDPATALKNLKCPILALNGDLDLVVSPSQNLSRIEQTLKDAGHSDYKTQVLPNHNHGMQTCKTGTFAEYAQSPETLSPQVLDEITNWILSRAAW